MREAMAARDSELANLQLALEFFNNEVDCDGTLDPQPRTLNSKHYTPNPKP